MLMSQVIMPQNTLTPDILAAALVGLEAQRNRIAAQLAELRERLRPAKAARRPAAHEAPKRKRTMSAEGRKRIVAAAKKRWAQFRKARKPAAAAKPVPKKKAAKKAPAAVTAREQAVAPAAE